MLDLNSPPSIPIMKHKEDPDSVPTNIIVIYRDNFNLQRKIFQPKFEFIIFQNKYQNRKSIQEFLYTLLISTIHFRFHFFPILVFDIFFHKAKV